MKIKELYLIGILIIFSVFSGCKKNDCENELIGVASLLPETRNQFPPYEDVETIIFKDSIGTESKFLLYEKKSGFLENGYYFKCDDDGPSSFTVDIEFVEYTYYDSLNNFVLEFRSSVVFIPREFRESAYDTILFDASILRIKKIVGDIDGYFSPEVTGLGWITERGGEIPDEYKEIIEESDNRDQPFNQIELNNRVFFDGYSTEYSDNVGHFNGEYGLVGFKLNNENLWVFDRFE